MKSVEKKMEFYDRTEKNSETILVTICCLAYNHERYIRDTLEGFVNQKTNFMYEVLIHDDASTDHTADIIREYEKKYPEIIKPVYQKENQYSKGVQIFETFMRPRIHGKYIASCEGDDYWTDADKLQKQIDVLEGSGNYVACVHQTVSFDMLTAAEKLYSILDKDCDVDMETVVLQWGKAFHISSLVHSTKCLEDAPEFSQTNKNGVGDFPIAVYLLLCGKVFYINEAMSVYRRNSSEHSWTSEISRAEDSKERMKSVWEEEIKMLEEADKYSDFKYHRIFEIGIMRKKFAMRGFQIGKGFWKDPYQRQIFREKSLIKKCGIILKIYIPKLYNRIYRIRHARDIGAE